MKTILVLFLLSASFLFGVPGLLNHQGRIAVNGANFDGTGYFKFSLVNQNASEIYWTNDHSIHDQSGQPATAIAILVAQGHYSTLLGETNPIKPSLFANNDDVRLRIWFSPDNSTFSQLAPDRRLTPAAYSFTAASLTPGFATGTGKDFKIQSLNNGQLTVATEFRKSFPSPPTVNLGDHWQVTSANESNFTATTSFNAQTIDASGFTGTDTSLAIISGHPAIAYRSDTRGDLLFIRSVDSSGTSWPSSSITRVDGALNDVGQYASLAEVAGRPAIAYYDATRGDLCFIRANNAAGSSWPSSPLRVDATGNVGRDVSLAVIAGIPAIAYQAPNTGEIKYAWAQDEIGASWKTTSIEGSLTDYRQAPSLIDLNGKPALSFYNQPQRDLRFALLTGVDPSIPSAWQIANILTNGNVGRHSSLTVIAGQAAVAFEDAAGTIKYSIASGAIWNAPVTIANGTSPSLADLNGIPGISFYDAASGDLKLAIANTPSGAVQAAWSLANQSIIDGSTTNVGTHNSLALVDGLPAISYHDASSLDLKFASLPLSIWNAQDGGAEPILASGVKDQGITPTMLSSEIGIWQKSGNDLFHNNGRVGIGRLPSANALEVEGTASKTTAGSWRANSDRRIKTNIRTIEGALEKIKAIRLVDFQYTEAYRKTHPHIDSLKRYPNVIAQEFATVFPDWVSESGETEELEKDPILQVDTYPVVIYSAAAIQELAKENRELKQRVRRLEKLIERLVPVDPE